MQWNALAEEVVKWGCDLLHIRDRESGPICDHNWGTVCIWKQNKLFIHTPGIGGLFKGKRLEWISENIHRGWHCNSEDFPWSPAIYQCQESEIWFLLHFVMELDFKCDLLWGGNEVLTSFAMQHLIPSAYIPDFYRTPSTLPPLQLALHIKARQPFCKSDFDQEESHAQLPLFHQTQFTSPCKPLSDLILFSPKSNPHKCHGSNFRKGNQTVPHFSYNWI